jgi:hypothetical protein
MSETDRIMGLIELLNSEDKALCEAAQKKIRGMGMDAIPYLNRAKGQPSRYDYLEVFKMLAGIGDDLFFEGGAENIERSIVDTMEFGARSILKSTPEGIREPGVQALSRWGLEVPKPYEQEISRCHVCDRSNSEIIVRNCFLLDCRKLVCEEHAFIIDGGFGTWFCSMEHKKYALENPNVLM